MTGTVIQRFLNDVDIKKYEMSPIYNTFKKLTLAWSLLTTEGKGTIFQRLLGMLLKEYIVTSFKSLLNNSSPSLPIVMSLAFIYFVLQTENGHAMACAMAGICWVGDDALL